MFQKIAFLHNIQQKYSTKPDQVATHFLATAFLSTSSGPGLEEFPPSGGYVVLAMLPFLGRGQITTKQRIRYDQLLTRATSHGVRIMT